LGRVHATIEIMYIRIMWSLTPTFSPSESQIGYRMKGNEYHFCLLLWRCRASLSTWRLTMLDSAKWRSYLIARCPSVRPPSHPVSQKGIIIEKWLIQKCFLSGIRISGKSRVLISNRSHPR
jgi:hypothetical protein